MRKIAKTSSGFHGLVVLGLCILAALLARCAPESQDALEKACRTAHESPEPDRQRCIETWGICVGRPMIWARSMPVPTDN
jgi:hypothetical protein